MVTSFIALDFTCTGSFGNMKYKNSPTCLFWLQVVVSPTCPVCPPGSWICWDKKAGPNRVKSGRIRVAVFGHMRLMLLFLPENSIIFLKQIWDPIFSSLRGGKDWIISCAHVFVVCVYRRLINSPLVKADWCTPPQKCIKIDTRSILALLRTQYMHF